MFKGVKIYGSKIFGNSARKEHRLTLIIAHKFINEYEPYREELMYLQYVA